MLSKKPHLKIYRRISILISSLLFLIAGTALGQSEATITIQTNRPESAVYIDSVYVGVASESRWKVTAGTHKVTLAPSQIDSWMIQWPSETVELDADETLSLELNFAYTYRIETLPYGATVSVETADGRRVLGETPLIFTETEPLSTSLNIDMPGYYTETIQPGSDFLNQHSILLRPETEEVAQLSKTDWVPQGGKYKWLDYTAAGVALASGILAVHYKFKGDDLFDEYNETGDPALKRQIDRYDNYSAIALGTMQVGVGVLAFRLVFR